ncbi:hypothetical protein [Streptosporangium sp. KLBMP 9127]|nr:hypothetical protein [Streptosporangium sp. KLBMP 9127]
MTRNRTPTSRGVPAAGGPAAGDGAGDGHRAGREFTLDLPLLSIQVRPPSVKPPHVPLPRLPHVPGVSRRELGHAMDVARTFLPPPERIAYYGGLGALAAFGVLDWPVAAAIGAGTVIAQRGRTEQRGGTAQRGRTAPRARTAPRGRTKSPDVGKPKQARSSAKSSGEKVTTRRTRAGK